MCVWCAHVQNPMGGSTPQLPTIVLGFLPLNHLMGRMTLFKSLLMGGQTYFVRAADMSTFFDDIRTVRPTEAMFPPRIMNMLHDRFVEMMDRLPATADEAGRAKQREVYRSRHWTSPFLAVKPVECLLHCQL